jgi:hypothetical protein
MPVAGLEYEFINRSSAAVEAIFSLNAENFMAEPRADLRDRVRQKTGSVSTIRSTTGGFVLQGAGSVDRPWDEGSWAAWVDDGRARVNHAWFRGNGVFGAFDSLRMVWKDVESGACYARDPVIDGFAPGASIFVPLQVPAGASSAIRLYFAWYVPRSNLVEPERISEDGKSQGHSHAGATYQPWYTRRFSGIDGVIEYWRSQYQSLRAATDTFTRSFYDSTLPPEVIEAVAANLTILKSPTVLRQADGRLWGWEGSGDAAGAGGYGSCTHVWNYSQAIAHLFPELERSLRDTEFGANQNEAGRQYSRAALPIRRLGELHSIGDPAADGQLGGIIKVYRDWRIAGDTAWLRGLWPRVRLSLDYCISTWDPEHRGWIEEPHVNTYDVEFWGPDSMCTSLYLGALAAAARMAEALGESGEQYLGLLRKGTRLMETELFNGEYFFQKIEWRNLRAAFPPNDAWERLLAGSGSASTDELELVRQGGPRYQYGQGCLSAGLLGVWLSNVCGLDHSLDASKVSSHLAAVHRHNFKQNLAGHVNVGRPVFACGAESGLLLCTWPRGGEPPLPFLYADEVWTGVEYQVAAQLIAAGKLDEGREIVRACRQRYDGRVRNPFAEVEAGFWYARAMASYALLQAFSGARFDAVDGTLHLKPAIKGDFRCFLSTATGFGTVGVKNGRPFVEVVSGHIPYKKIEYTAA